MVEKDAPVKAEQTSDRQVTVTTVSTSSSSTFDTTNWPPKPVDPLKTLDYEIQVFRRLRTINPESYPSDFQAAWPIKNAVAEATIMHARILCGIFLSGGTHEDDIKLSKILESYEQAPKTRQLLAGAILRLKSSYERGETSARGTFNKFVMHASDRRGSYGAYTDFIASFDLIFEEIIALVEDVIGRKFGQPT